MKKFNIAILLLTVLVTVIGITFAMLATIDNEDTQKDRVYVVLKTNNTDIDFWQIALDGAEIAAMELGVEVVVEGPGSEEAIEEQIQIMYQIIEEGPEAIAIAACDYHALAEVCDAAEEAGIRVVTFDSDVAMTTDHSFVATNSYNASKRIAHELATLSDMEGTVAIIAHVEGVSTSIERIQGFKQGMKAFEDIHVIDQIHYAGDSRKKAYDMAVNLFEEHPELTAIYATNEVTLGGVGEAIRDHGLEEKIILLGFDMSKDIALMIEERVIDGTMVQRPFNMGYIAVKEALEVTKGDPPETLDTGAVLINKENMFLPENQKLIVP